MGVKKKIKKIEIYSVFFFSEYTFALPMFMCSMIPLASSNSRCQRVVGQGVWVISARSLIV